MTNCQKQTKYKALSTKYRLRRHRLRFQLLSLVMRDESVDERIEIAFHHEVQLMDRQTNPMIADAVFLEVISTNLFRAIAGANHRTTLACLCFVLLLLFKLLKTRAQNSHRLFAVLDLRLLVLHRNDNAGWQVRQPHCGVSRVY